MTNNISLSHFRDFPSNFLEWLLQFSLIGVIKPKYNLQDAKKIYIENSRKDLGFIYKKYMPKSASFDSSWYDEYDFIPSINVEVCSIGDPELFFGSISDYKKLLNNLMMDNEVNQTKIYKINNLRNFYQFGNIYCFKDNTIKNPIDIF